MKLEIESTDEIVELNGVPARVWQGKTESGIEVFCFVTRVAVASDADQAQFEAELQSVPPPARVFSSRFVL